MNNKLSKFVFEDTYDKQHYRCKLDNDGESYYLTKQELRQNNIDDLCLSEIDFYPPSDNRVLESYIEDIECGDNFADYCEYIFDILEEEGYYD